MKLSDYAKQAGISYKTAWRWWKRGYIKGKQLPTGTIVVEVDAGDLDGINLPIQNANSREDLIQAILIILNALVEQFYSANVADEINVFIEQKLQGDTT